MVVGLEAIGQRLPFPIHGIDSDTCGMGSDGVFINETLIGYCADHDIEFTRSRAYRSNDQAWIEQKNGSVVRRFVGHERYSGQVAGQTMAHLYGALHLYVNFFQPSFKLIDKTRDGATTVKRYSPPTTSCDRLIQHDETNDEMRAALKEYRARLQAEHPDRFSAAQLRTMQRRVKQWRGIMAKELVYAGTEETFAEPRGLPELALIGADSKC